MRSAKAKKSRPVWLNTPSMITRMPRVRFVEELEEQAVGAVQCQVSGSAVSSAISAKSPAGSGPKCGSTWWKELPSYLWRERA
jgi:hypothetical protein